MPSIVIRFVSDSFSAHFEINLSDAQKDLRCVCVLSEICITCDHFCLSGFHIFIYLFICMLFLVNARDSISESLSNGGSIQW